MIMGAALAAKALGRSDLISSAMTATPRRWRDRGRQRSPPPSTRSPFIMGQIAFAVTMDALNGDFPGGFVETPTSIVDAGNVLPVLQDADSLYPKPSRNY
jgi:ribose transport system substrate-binding protein